MCTNKAYNWLISQLWFIQHVICLPFISHLFTGFIQAATQWCMSSNQAWKGIGPLVTVLLQVVWFRNWKCPLFFFCILLIFFIDLSHLQK